MWSFVPASSGSWVPTIYFRAPDLMPALTTLQPAGPFTKSCLDEQQWLHRVVVRFMSVLILHNSIKPSTPKFKTYILPTF